MSVDRQKVQELLLSLSMWASMARREEVVVVRPAQALGKLEVLDYQLGVRPSGTSGIHVMDKWANDNESVILQKFAEDKGLPEAGYSPARLYPSDHLTPLETASRLSDAEKAAQDRNLAVMFSAVEDEEHGYSKAEASLPLAGPNSKAIIRLFYDGVPTVLNRLLSVLCPDTISLVEYGMSMMNAHAKAFLPDSEDGTTNYKVVIADLSKPLWKDPDSHFDRYASVAGGDGNTTFSWQKADDPQGQIRAFVANLTKKSGILIKGVAVGDTIGWKDGKLSGDADAEPILLCDLDMIKAAGKHHPAYKEAKNHPGDYAHPVLVDEKLYAWFIRVTKSAEDHHGQQSESFQGTGFFHAPLEGVEGACGVYNRVHARTMHENLVAKICRIDDTRQQLADECLGLVGIDLDDYRMDNGEIPYRAVLESVTGDLERICSAGTFRKGQLLKVWGNQLTPAGVVLMDDDQMAYGHLDAGNAELLRLEFEAGDVPFFESEYYQQGYALFGRLVAHKRTPQLSPLGISTSRALSKSDLDYLYDAIFNGDTDWECEEGYILPVYETLVELMSIHNWRVQDRRYDLTKGSLSKWVQMEASTDDGDITEWALRICEWAISLADARIVSFFVANPLDGRDRNEDHDGDDTVCCPSRFLVDKYASIERFWMRLAYPFINELPKSEKMDWRHPRLTQPLANPKGEMEDTVNIKGAHLSELFPSIEWCTSERLEGVIRVTMSEAQGPTGMASNVAADLFARIRWMEDPEGKRNRHGILIVPTPDTYRIFLMWVFYCLLVQICIDWKKRAYRMFRLVHGERVANALIEAGWQGLKNFEGVIAEEEYATQDTTYGMDKLELAENWCYNPSIIYQYAQDVLEIEVCLWKWKRGELTFPVPSSRIMEELAKMPMTRFRAVGEAFHAPRGILASFGKARDYSEMLAAKVKGSTTDNDLGKHITSAFSYLESATLQSGDRNDLEKLSPSYRGALFLNGLGFDREAQEKLLEGEAVKSTAISGDAVWSYKDIMIAAAHAAAGREVDAFQIVVSFYVSQKETSAQAKELISYGEDLSRQFLRGIATKADATVEIPLLEDDSYPMLFRCMDADLLKHWKNVAHSGRAALDKVLPDIAREAIRVANLDETKEDAITLAKLAVRALLQITVSAETYSRRTERYLIGGIKRRSFRYAALIPKDEYQVELSELPAHVRNSHVGQDKDDGRLYVRANGKNKAKLQHLYNGSSAHQWLSAVGHDDPVRMAYQTLEGKGAFRVHPNAARAYVMACRLFDMNEQHLVKCRTLTGHGGYFTATVFDKAIDLAVGDDYSDETSGGIARSLSLLRGCSNRRINFGDEYNDNGYETKQFFRQELLNGELNMLECPSGDDLNWSDWLNEHFGLTPIPQTLSFGIGENRLEGIEALPKLIGDLLLCIAVEEFIFITDKPSDRAWTQYRQAKEWARDQIREYDLPLDPETFPRGLYWFTPMARDSKLPQKRARLKRLQALATAYAELGV